MSQSSTKSLTIRRVGSVAGVGTAFVEIPMVVPTKGKIRRVRASVTAGTSINQVKLEIRETAGGTVLNVPLAYALGAQPLDSAEDVLYRASASPDNSRVGTLYVAVAVDNATADHAITVSLDIDVAA
jgi:hypothetical protein